MQPPTGHSPKRKPLASALRSPASALQAAGRFTKRHEWLIAFLIVLSAIAILVIRTLLLPIPEAQGAYTVNHSLRFNDNDSAYLTRTPGSTSSRNLWTISTWVKRSNLGLTAHIWGVDTTSRDRFYFNTSDQLVIQVAGTVRLLSTQVFRDPARWHHLVIVFEAANATAALRLRVYLDGEEITAWSTDTRSGIATGQAKTSTNVVHDIGRVGGANQDYFDGYLSDFHFVSGAALGPIAFGETNPTTGAWVPKEYAGTYGTNGFRLNFSNSAALGTDVSGTGNNWTVNNMNATDQMRDTPSNNFATFNPINVFVGGQTFIYADGNTLAQSTNGNAVHPLTINEAVGDWYAECVPFNLQGTTVGVTTWSPRVLYRSDGQKDVGGTVSAYGASYTTGDIIGIAVSQSNNTVEFFKNGASQGLIAVTLNRFSVPTFTPGSNNGGWQCNWGQGGMSGLTYYPGAGGSFTYDPPAGFKALSTAHLPAPVITRPKEYFDTVLYAGNGGTQSITSLGFAPAFTWIKSRTSTNGHALFDTVRGASQRLTSNTTDAETTESGVTAFLSNGFTLGNQAAVNSSGNNYVAWNWKEDPTSGFDIVTYTGDNTSNRDIAHSLGRGPAFVLVKRRDNTGNWYAWHTGLSSAAHWVIINDTNAESNTNSPWGTGSWTGTTFRVTNNGTNNLNANGATYVAYLFAQIPGYSQFGTYTGNGNANGPFVYTGFKPRYLLYKRINTTGNWVVRDTARAPFNPSTAAFVPNTNAAEVTSGSAIDILSNGFKQRGTGTGTNNSGITVIYAAFAELPFKYATAGADASAPPFVVFEF